MKLTFIQILIFLLVFNSNAQDVFDNYKPIESEGTIPTEFLTKSSEKVKEEIDNFTSGEKGKTKKYKKDFLISSTFGTRQVLLSGKVLYNDPVTKYINKVASEIFKTNSDLNKDNFRIYAYKSPIVNAFAFNDGLVLINLGLIAQLENEAQLALILSHEFTHVVNKDAIELFLSSKEIDNGTGVYKNISFDDRALYKSQYSQEKESTADLQGLEYYKNTNYSLKPINGVFDVLKYSYLPFDDVPFDTAYFEKGSYQFPSDYKLSELNPISPDGNEDEDEDEEILKTHPGADDRRDAILNEITIAELKNNSKKVFIVSSEKEFKKIRTISRFEMPRMYLLHGYYEMAFYNAFLLEEAGFKNNIYLEKMKAKAIGQMARAINNGNRPTNSRVKAIKAEMQGESQQLYYFLNKLGRKRKEFNVFAVQYTYEILKKHPKDEELKNMFSDLMFDLYSETKLKFSSFRKANIGESFIPNSTATVDSSTTISSEEQKAKEKSEKEKLMDEVRDENSKYNKIEKKVKEQKEVVEKKSTKKSKNEYYKYAFVNFMKDKKFVREAKKIEKKFKKERDKELTEAETKRENKKVKLDRNRGVALGIEKVVVVNPIYIVIQGDNNKLQKSEKAQEEYNAIIDRMAKISKLEIEVIDVKNLEGNKEETFKNASILNEYISEQFLYDEDFEFSSIELEKIKELKNTYNTRYFLWSGVVSLSEKKHTLVFNLLYDIEENKVLYKEFKDVRYKTNKNIIKSELYHVFDQINTKRTIK